MTLHAKDIMVRDFTIIHEEAPAAEAIKKISNGIVRETGYKTDSLMVIDEFNKLTGIVTLFDILYHLRPDFLNFGIDSEELEWEGQLNVLIDRFSEKKVYNIMTRGVVGVKKDDHLIILLDRMVKNKYRRLPVLENDKPIGVVYLTDIYYHLFSNKTI